MASIARIPSVSSPGDATELRDRARGALLGLAVGDALGAPAENLKPSEIRARWGRITGYVVEQPAGTDDTEYAIFSGLLLARHGCALTPEHAEAAWHEWIANRHEGPFRGAGFSERGTLENLRRGLAAPISAQHRHAWSDGLAMRAAPFGVFAAGRPAEAARLVAIDGSVSHDGEGIYGGQAVAAGVAAAMAGAPVSAVVAAALAVVPDDSWTARSLRRAVAVAHRGERAVRSAVVVGGYPWTDLAPEAVALAFGAYASADGDFRRAVLTAVNMGRDADTTAAVAGALAGATEGAGAVPPDWAAAIGPARGSCLPSMAGRHVLDVADLLVERAPAPPLRKAPELLVEDSPERLVKQASEPLVGQAPELLIRDASRLLVHEAPEPLAEQTRELLTQDGPELAAEGASELPVEDASEPLVRDGPELVAEGAPQFPGREASGAGAAGPSLPHVPPGALCDLVALAGAQAAEGLAPDTVRGEAHPAAEPATVPPADTAAYVPAACAPVEQGTVRP